MKNFLWLLLLVAQDPVIHTDVNEVLVPVVVTDRKAHYAAGLTRADFAVFEDGVKQEITVFQTSTELAPDVPHAGAAAHRQTSSAAAPAHIHTYLICIDTLHSALSSFAHARDALLKFFEHENAPGSQYALVALGREPRMLQDSTPDPKVILAALNAKTFSTSIADTESLRTASEEQQFTELMKRYCSACACANFPPVRSEATLCNARTGTVRAALDGSGERGRALALNFVEGLHRLVKATASMEGAHTIIMISDGFNRFPGRELYGIAEAFSPRDRSFVFNPRDVGPEIQNVLKLAVKTNIRFYTLDARGLYSEASLGASGGFDAGGGLTTQSRGQSMGVPPAVGSQARSVARENTDALSQLARDTGGLFFENSNDLLKGLRRAFSDSREYYLLGYVPKNLAHDGAYRRITVEMRDRKLQVTSKPGYWAQ